MCVRLKAQRNQKQSRHTNSHRRTNKQIWGNIVKNCTNIIVGDLCKQIGLIDQFLRGIPMCYIITQNVSFLLSALIILLLFIYFTCVWIDIVIASCRWHSQYWMLLQLDSFYSQFCSALPSFIFMASCRKVFVILSVKVSISCTLSSSDWREQLALFLWHIHSAIVKIGSWKGLRIVYSVRFCAIYNVDTLLYIRMNVWNWLLDAGCVAYTHTVEENTAQIKLTSRHFC